MNALKKFLEEEALAINSVAKNLSNEDVEKALLTLNNCRENKGKLIISGVGKSGIIARKIAATFSSLGLTSIYLNPIDALHGDLGLVNSVDICLLISNSGETGEILQLLPHLIRRGSRIIALVGRAKSSLGRSSQIVLEAKVDKEVCPLNLAPTTSTSVAMAIGDALAAEFIRRSSISRSDFAFNHPAGSLGKKLLITAKDLMIPIQNFTSLYLDTKLTGIIAAITKDGMGVGMVKEKINSGKMLGIITDGDLRRALEQNPNDKWANLSASDIMTKSPLKIDKNCLAIDALQMMEQNTKGQVTVLPVVSSSDNEKILGFLRLHDLIQEGFS